MKSGTRFMLIFGSAIALSIAVLLAASSDATAQAQIPAAVSGAVTDSRAALAEPLAAAQRSMAEAVVPALVAAQDMVVESMPERPAPPASPALQGRVVSPASVDMIVGFEIVSRAYYAKRLEAPIWPEGQSGVTWGIGYDGGHQRAATILVDWAQHPGRQRLARTAGVIGTPAKALARELRDVRTPLPMAEQVFADRTLPTYAAMAERAFHNGWECLAPDPQGSLVATTYNRGTSMRGNSRREMRELRDECVPRCDTACMAAAFRSMKRLWVGTPLEAGLARRYEATARLAEGAGA